jgi:hypothetical protein
MPKTLKENIPSVLPKLRIKNNTKKNLKIKTASRYVEPYRKTIIGLTAKNEIMQHNMETCIIQRNIAWNFLLISVSKLSEMDARYGSKTVLNVLKNIKSAL